MTKIRKPRICSLEAGKKYLHLPNIPDAEIDAEFQRTAADAVRLWNERGEGIKNGEKVFAFKQKHYTRMQRMFDHLLATIDATRLAGRDRRLALEKRVEALEQRPVLRHLGIWQEGKAYTEHNLVTLNGSMWLCLRGTRKARPGQSKNWQLVVKRGSV